MKDAIAVVGAPVSGKSTLVKPFTHKLIQVGEYAHSLPDDHPVKRKCMEHWRDNTVFGPDVLEAILRSYPLDEEDWYMFDGTPRDAESMPVVSKLFNVAALIEITVNPDIWMERAEKVSNNGRRVRYDSSMPQLLKRREVYEEKMQGVRPYFPRHYVLDNSGDLEHTRREFGRIIAEVFPGETHE